LAVIQVRNLTKKYRPGEDGEVQALVGVTLTFQASEFVSVYGRSGSGKTTLLHSVGLLARPTTGQVIIDGVDTATLTDGQRADFRGRRIGFVLQDRNLLPTLTVLENVLLPQRYARIDTGARKRARELLDLVGVADRMTARPHQLTPGQAQRVAIARALIKAPTLVLADEPTGEVDAETSDELLYLMQQINRTSGVAFVIASHDMEVASCMDRMIRLSGGRVTSDERLRPAQGWQ
jgi:putative ABC transport system ATP-binding protein